MHTPHLIGLRLGDLNVYKASNDSETIVVRYHSTVQDQMALFRELFGPYGYVWQGSPDQRGAVNATCYLNLSFDFLLPKEDKVEPWIQQDNRCAAAFVAGYVDAEGTFGI